MSSKAKIEALQAALTKRFPRPPKAPERSVFLHLIFAACLENASHDDADAAMVVLEQQFVDWNEVRVSTPAELSEVLEHVLTVPPPLEGIPSGSTVGERVKRALQAVFERSYTFTLDDISSLRPAANAIAALKGLAGLTPFMVDYVIHHALGGHVIPLDEAALRVMRRLGIVHIDTVGNETAPQLAKVIAKADGLGFATRLHSLAAEFFATPDSAATMKFLKGIDPDSINRSWLPPSSPLPLPAVLPIELKANDATPLVPESPKPAPTKTVTPKTVTPKTDVQKILAAKTTLAKPVPTKPPPKKAVPAKPAPTKTAPAKPAPAKAAPVKKTPTKVAPKSAPKKAAPAKKQPVKKPVVKPVKKVVKPVKKVVKPVKSAKQTGQTRQSATKQLRRSKPR